MTPDQVFNLVNLTALLAWIYLIGVARWTPRVFLWMRYAVPMGFALVYGICLIMSGPNEDAGFQTLAEVTAIFTQPWAVVGGWIHYLAFDFFIGSWILAKAKAENIAHVWIVIPMILTFMLGPVGLFLFLLLLKFWKPRREVQTA